MDPLPKHLRPKLNAFTLHFLDPEKERGYRTTYPIGMISVTRIALAFGILMVFLFGFVDAPSEPHTRRLAWLLRLSVIGSFAALLALSTTSFYRRNMQALMMLAALTIIVVYSLVISLEPWRLDNMYMGFIAILLASFAGLALQLSYMLPLLVITLVAFTGLVLYGGHDISALQQPLLYMGACLILVLLGSYSMDRQRRMSYHIRCEIEREREESRIQALHDPLTGLPNRRLLMQSLEKALKRDRRSGRFSVLMFLDLDGFKAVNDTYGHDAGDEALTEVARRLGGAVREVDTVARLGGDEFIVLFEDVAAREDAGLLADRLMGLFDQPIKVDGHSTEISASIGVAIHPGDGLTPEALLHAADEAMYAAKRKGGHMYSQPSDAA